jgi:hypothetical protein
MKIKATYANLEDDGYCKVLSFADDQMHPQQYLILQMTNSPSQQDLQLGHGGVHIDLGGHALNGYGLITNILMTAEGLVLTIDRNAAREAGIDEKICIDFQETSVDRLYPAEAIEAFKQRLEQG